MKAFALAVLCLSLFVPSVADAASAALACFERGPEPDSVRALRLTVRDPSGKTTVLLQRLYGRRDARGLGQLFLRVEEPASLRGRSLLMLQREQGESEIYLASPEQPTPRTIRGAEREQSMFGTDFSYADLERVQRGWRPGASEIVELPATRVNDRPAYVLEVRPHDSVWQRIVFSLDQQTCLPLLIQFFEPGLAEPRKELTTDPKSHVKHGDSWFTHSAMMRDRVKYTSTFLMVDSQAQEALLTNDQFTVEGLERAARGEPGPPR